LSLPVEDLAPTALVVDHWHQQVEDVVTESGLHRRLFTEASKFFSNSDWEYLLTDVLQRLNPGWKVKRTGGKAEAKHGTDILATIPNLFRDGQYGIAIQVKDYEGFVNDDPIHAILKAKEGFWKDGFWKDRGIEIVELVIVVVQGDKQAAHQLEESAKKAGVNVIWSSDVEELVFLAACNFLSDSESHFSFDQSS
jgi:hypothetical protein